MCQGKKEEVVAGITDGLEDYEDFLADIKGQIQTAQVRAAFAVSRELVQLYWRIGQSLAIRQEQQRW